VTTEGRPSRAELAAAAGRAVPDVIGPGLDVLFCGINPGLYSGAVGHHFARPGNRFWAALHASGFTPRRLGPFEEADLLLYGLGITNFVARATAGANELTADELRRGAGALAPKVARYRPRFVAFLGLGAYRAVFDIPSARVGPQHAVMPPARSWLLPNPSGLNAHWRPAELAEAFAELRAAVRQAAPVAGRSVTGSPGPADP
jgi:double-stranded uracil-DNA glycosylase